MSALKIMLDHVPRLADATRVVTACGHSAPRVWPRPARCPAMPLKGPKWLEGVNSLFKFLQTSLNQDVSKTNSEASALAQLCYASHLNNSSRYEGYNL
jgi:hypothetical protein